MISIDELLEELDFIIEKAVGVPLSGGMVLVNAEKVKEIIDNIRMNLPNEIRQARIIAAERADILAKARKEAEGITRRAEERARTMISSEEVVRRAQIQASDTVAQGQMQAREIRKKATDYAENIMRTTEDTLSKQLAALRQARTSLHATVSSDADGAAGGEDGDIEGVRRSRNKSARAAIDVAMDTDEE